MGRWQRLHNLFNLALYHGCIQTCNHDFIKVFYVSVDIIRLGGRTRYLSLNYIMTDARQFYSIN